MKPAAIPGGPRATTEPVSVETGWGWGKTNSYGEYKLEVGGGGREGGKNLTKLNVFLDSKTEQVNTMVFLKRMDGRVGVSKATAW